jgi:murein DD-endopeptidase MepM/ murein hydrolase activator NlpD
MRYTSTAVCSALTAIALLAPTASAQGGAVHPSGARVARAPYSRALLAGGARAPSPAAHAQSALLTGGSEYGVSTRAAAARRPVVSRLRVPSSMSVGRPPRVTLRIDEKGVATVRVGVAVTDLSTRRTVIVVDLGWVHTGRLLTVSWPRAARLKAGSYHVSVIAHDHHSGTLLRTAHSSGVATVTVAAPLPPPSALPPAAPEPGVLTPAQSVADGAVFPVTGLHTFGGPENRFGAPRGSHVHQGQDVLTSEGTPVVAPLAGTILTTSYQAGGAGYYAVEHTPVGFDFMFAHCASNSLAVGPGQAVPAGQMLCLAGQTGDATTPHLHFEIWVGGWQASTGHPIDPLPYLEAWDHP